MSASTVTPVLGHNYRTIDNANKNRSAIEHVIEFEDSAYGAYRALHLLDKISQAAAMVLTAMGNTFSLFFSSLASKLSSAWAFLILPTLPKVTQKAWKAMTTWGVAEGPEGYPMRANMKKVHDIFECGAAWSYGVSLVAGSPSLKQAGDILDFGSSMTDLPMAAEDWSLAKKHLDALQNTTNEALKERFEDTKKDAMLRVIKSVASVVSGVIGLLVLALGGPIVPGAVLLGLSLISALTSISAHFFKETRNYQLVEFFKGSGQQIEGVTVY